MCSVGFCRWFKAIGTFSAASLATFALLSGASWFLLGGDYLWNGLLYHLVRIDHRHNYSFYFYSIYLDFDIPTKQLWGVLLFLPQIFLLGLASLLLGMDLPFCVAIQTFMFVAFNKVCTAQYFVW
jgi:GPI mannosyltransferase 1 subunit M